jgi:hypothetical protein
MTFANRMRSHQSRCQPQLLKLRMLALSEADAVLCQQVTADIRDATNAIIAEAEAMSFAALGDGSRRELEAETFLRARLIRLATAADQAVNAARSGDVPGLRAHLNRFDTLMSAIWTVQRAVYGQEPAAEGAGREP